jgi:hypothetical protein
MEAERLNFLRFNQSKLRVGKYKNLNEYLATDSEGTSQMGKRVVLPTSFVGGKRYMDALYFDGMAISAAVGFPDLFITFTCNPNWPEIQALLQKDNLKSHDRPDIVTRVFKIKFDERMFFHLLGEQAVYYTDYERLNDVLIKPSVTESMFTSWFEANKKYPEAKTLTYGQFVTKFVYVKKNRCWKPRTRGNTIGRLVWIPQGCGEIYFLRMMLTVVKGPESYDSIKNVRGFQHDSFREACFASGFLKDDRLYIEAIKEASTWGSGHFLRRLFVTMLMSGSVNRPYDVWVKTKHLLCDGILYRERMKARNKGQ